MLRPFSGTPPDVPTAVRFAATKVLTRLKVGDPGAAVWETPPWPESTVEASDSSHSGIVMGGTCWWPLVGLEGAEIG